MTGKALTLGVPTAPDRALFHQLSEQVFASGQYANNGPLAALFEMKLGQLYGQELALFTSSGTSALTLALQALKLPHGTEVLTPALTFVATSSAIEAAGLKPRFVPCHPVSLTLDPGRLEPYITSRVGAILAVHLLGVECDSQLDALAQQHQLPLIYDAAHIFPQEPEGAKELLGRGRFSCISLHATKLLHSGEGGAVFCQDPQDLPYLQQIRNFGLNAGIPQAFGINGKASELSAALGLAVIPEIGKELVARRALAQELDAIMQASPRAWVHPRGRHSNIFYAFRCEPGEQKQLVQQLQEKKIMARTFPALTQEGSYWSRYALDDLPLRQESDELAQSFVALPFHSQVDQKHLESIYEVLNP
ncbi:DegT/DnrJ/EryC1/StrS family aminotransferase [Rothia sp. CCM 9417]|uniref:DegT/DnrJ/EryC1/StrS family aminotransferase n=1 Tax=unclassified Rothia (in: high G+C Gram-positive bacteria) TaxID=2689056 RepID=UPI003AC26E8F